MTDQLRAYLVALAEHKIPEDKEDFTVSNYSGGNIDDAYSMGEVAGEVQLARLLLSKFGGPNV